MTDAGAFIKKTNEEYIAWCKTFYEPEAEPNKRVELYGLWAWQEQERRLAIAVLAAAREALAGSGAPFLSADDLADLKRLDELFSDGEGWDIPKERMQRLAELGVIRRTSGTHHAITAFGQHCIDPEWGLPLRTAARATP